MGLWTPYPLTDFLVHRAMVDDRRRRSPEQRARNAERMRVSRRILANATGPDALSAQQSLREQKRDSQRRRRERLNAERLNSDRVPPPPFFYPCIKPKLWSTFSIGCIGFEMTCTDAISVLRNIMVWRCKGHGATGVLARYRRSSLHTSFTDALQKNIHRYSAENHVDPGDIPPYLRPILFDLTQMEEMLCSLASPCFLMWV